MPQNTPWTIERSGTGSGIAIAVRDAAGRDVNARAIGFSTSSEANENTDLIVRAVNAHDELFMALRQCAAELGSLHHASSDMEHAKAHSPGLRMALDALSKAEAR